ncbi:MAG: insulinase family protein [Bacteroidaceae bacterium]|nr:insulinase family protein [Bacteroidaceae bacterium]
MLDRTIQPKLSPLGDFVLPVPEDSTFSNNIPVSVLNVGGQDIVRVDIVINAGKMHQEKLLVSYFTGMMLKEGTSTMSRQDIAEKLDFYGSWMVVQSTTIYTCVTLFSLNKYLKESMDIVVAAITDSQFPDEQLDKFRQIQYHQWLVNNEKVEVMSNRAFHSNFFGSEHICGRYADDADYNQLTSDDLKHFFRKYYNSGNCRIYLSGMVTDKVVVDVERLVGTTSWGQISEPTQYIPQTVCKTSEKRVFVEKKDATQSAVKMGKMLISRKHPDYAKLRLLMSLFGGSFSSRLMSNIREDKGYTYGINASYMHVPDASYMLISSECDNQYVEPLIAEVYKEMALLRDVKIEEDELRQVKNYLQGDMMRTYEDPLTMMGAYISMDYNNVGRGHLARCFNEANAATTEELHLLAQKYFTEDGFLEAIAGKKINKS